MIDKTIILKVAMILAILAIGCTNQKKIAYLSNLPEKGGEESFTMEVPDYRIQTRDILYVTIKAMTPEGFIVDFLSTTRTQGTSYVGQGESGGYLYGYDVNPDGNIYLPSVGPIKLQGLTLSEARLLIQAKADLVFKNSTVECKLLSFKFTVIGEVKAPGSYINYNNYLTVLEAIGRAGGVGDFGNRDRVLIVRPVANGSKTYRLNLQDKDILSSETYFLLPNDVVIVEPQKHKIFNLNLPTFSFILSSLTTTLLLLDYFNK